MLSIWQKYPTKEKPPIYSTADFLKIEFVKESSTKEQLQKYKDVSLKPIMKYQFEIIENIKNISETEWNSIDQHDGWEDHNQVVFKTNSLPQTRPHSWLSNVVVRSEKGLVAKSTVDFFPYHLWLPSHKLRMLSRFTLGKLSAMTVRNPPEFAKDIDYDKVMPVLIKGYNEIRRKKHVLATRIMNLEQDSNLLKYLRQAGYSIASGQSLTVMDVKWKNFEEYLQSFKKKRRYEVKRQINAARKAKISIEEADPLENENINYKLMRDVMWKHKGELRFCPGLFSKNADFLRKNAIVLTAKINNRVIGTLLALKNDFTIRIMTVGLDYDLSHQYNVYRLLYYRLIKLAIENNIKYIHGGAGTYDIKVRLGFSVTPTVTAIWVKPKVLLRVYGYTPSSLVHAALTAQADIPPGKLAVQNFSHYNKSGKHN